MKKTKHTILRITSGELKGKDMLCKNVLDAMFWAQLINKQYGIPMEDMLVDEEKI